MKVNLGYSVKNNPYKAVQEGLKRILKEDITPDFAIVFFTNYDPEEIFKGIKELLPNTKIVGCSGEGIIIEGKLYKQGVGILTITDKNFRLETFLEEKDPSQRSYNLGENIGEKILKKGFKKGTILLFVDCFKIDTQDLLQGLYDTLGPNFNFLGCGVGKISEEIMTVEVTEKGIIEGGISLAVFDELDFTISCRHGWKAEGDPLVITNAKGIEVIEIDGKSAYLAYNEKLKGVSRERFFEYTINNPLGFPKLNGDFLIRDPFAVIENERILFAGKIHKNSVGYIMKGEIPNLIKTAKRLTEEIAQSINNPKFALIFECISRSHYMQERFKDELKIIKNTLFNIPIIGILSFGEIKGFNEVPLYHNKSVVIGIAGEKLKDKTKNKNIQYPLYAELSILHEISSFTLPEIEDELYEEIKEKVGRFFNIQIFSLLLKHGAEYKLVSFLGCKDKEKILSLMKEEKPNQYKYFLKEDLGIIFIQQKNPLSEKEIKIYTIFSKKIEELLTALQNIKMQKEYEEKLKKLSLTDDLTGLYNRRGFITLVEQQLKTLERLQMEGVLIYIDIDNMKSINDRYGHLIGDDCLINFSLILKKTFRESDIIARIGGDEFAIFCVKTSEKPIEALLDRLYKNIEEFNTSQGKPYKLSISLGYSMYEKDKKLTLEELMDIADKKMYKEKEEKKKAHY